jgi:catechol 2,3-dioxygenase-like lactoylglutathione lyase family enzyme
MTKLYTGLEHIGIRTRDLAASEDFYVNKLGFSLLSREQATRPNGEAFGMVFVGFHDCVIELIEVGPDAPAGDGTLAHIALRVEDIDATVAELTGRGVDFPTPMRHTPIFENGIRNIFFPGPSGETLELCEHL